MSIQSLAWALAQPIPGTAKLVLLGLAERADHVTGRIEFDAAAVAAVASIREPSLWRYIGALERNGFVVREDRKSDGQREYWLALDRDPAAPWAWAAQDADAGDDGTARAGSPAANALTFDPEKQAAQRQKANALPPGQPEGMIPIIEGSKADRAWSGHLRARGKLKPFTQTILVSGQPCRGYWMPALFPPAAGESAA